MGKKTAPNRRSAVQPKSKKTLNPSKPMSDQKKRILYSIAAVAVVLVALLLFWPDGSIPFKRVLKGQGASAVWENVIQYPGNENWLTVDLGKSNHPKYFKVGSVIFPEGFTRDAKFRISSDQNLLEYRFLPNSQEAPISFLYCRGVNKPAQEIIEYAQKSSSSVYQESKISEVLTIQVNGYDASYFISRTGNPNPDTKVMEYNQSLSLYLPARKNCSVLVSASRDIPNLDGGLSDEELLNQALFLAKLITLDPK